jgi:glycosyltransferase involved in cell wall biosynthesis
MSGRLPFSVCVTTLDNAATLDRCLASAGFADEIIVLDSGSSDETVAIARRHGARVETRTFAGYGPQKLAAIRLASHRHVLLLDADEELTADARIAIERALLEPGTLAGWTLGRREQLFWRLQARHARHNPMLRLFDRERVRFSDDPIHAAPTVDGPIVALDATFLHWGEPDIATKVEKVNRYSSGMVAHRLDRPRYRWPALRMVVQPPWHFFRSYVLKRKFLAGSAGFIGCVVDAFYVFLKYAKLVEANARRKAGLDQS